MNKLTYDKELLLKDLSARFPYGVYCSIDDKKQPMLLYSISGDTLGFVKNIAAMRVHYVTINRVKPYLRPMSSMTEKEKEIWYNIYPTVETIDFLNLHHFDYRHLIEKGLALKAKEDMYDC